MNIQNPMNLPLPESLAGGGLVIPFREKTPIIGENVFLAPNASIIGEVILGDNVSVWFGAALRGDIAAVEVGEGSNIQDNSVLHVGTGAPCIVGRYVVVGHLAILHACTVEDSCLIGMGAIVLDGAVIGNGSVIGAGTLVTQGTVIPPYSLVLGSPGKVIRELTEDERIKQSAFALKYVELAGEYRQEDRVTG
ncbi:MAG: gamma carbonic anhydrase family protein [Candidatus Omnitrophota bacterium]